MRPSTNKPPILLILLGGLIGAILFLLLLGPSSLRVQNVDWLLNYDSGAHYVAWSFLRLEPWSLPVGRMNLYGAEMASNAVFADAIPLVSLPLKVLSPFLPPDFQFFGWWAMACFVLQGMAAVWLLGKFTRRVELLLIGAAFFAMQPIMLHRFAWHFALMAQWLIPMGFALFFSTATQRRIWLAWLVLLLAAVAVHAYLLLMLLILFSIWVTREVLLLILDKSQRQALLSLLSGGLIVGMVWAFMAALDYFRPMMLDWGAVKDYRGVSNLLGWLLPTTVEGFLLPPHDGASDYQHEGFWYLGAGGLVLLACALGAWIFFRRSSANSFSPLPHRLPGVIWGSFGLALLFFLILSTGLSLTFGSHMLLDLALPEGIQSAIDIFRWVGRFIWPVATGFLFLALLGTCLLPRWLATVILVLCVGLQFFDLRLFAIHELRPKQEPTGISQRLLDPRWDELMARHEGISVIPYPVNRFLGMEYDLGLLAYKHRMKIDAAYYARYPASRNIEPMWQRFHDFWRARPDPKWLYVVHEDLLKCKNLKAWKTLLHDNPHLLVLDNYYVASFLPDGKGEDSSMEWHVDSLSTDWEILSPGIHSFANMGGKFDSLFLGGFEPRSDGAGLSHDLGVMAFRILEDGGSLRLKFIPRNPANNHILLVKGELLSAGKVVAEQEARPDQGWSEFTLRFSDIPKGDCILRLEVQFFDEKSGDWLPRRGNNVILMEAEFSH